MHYKWMIGLGFMAGVFAATYSHRVRHTLRQMTQRSEQMYETFKQQLSEAEDTLKHMGEGSTKDDLMQRLQRIVSPFEKVEWVRIKHGFERMYDSIMRDLNALVKDAKDALLRQIDAMQDRPASNTQ